MSLARGCCTGKTGAWSCRAGSCRAHDGAVPAPAAPAPPDASLRFQGHALLPSKRIQDPTLWPALAAKWGQQQLEDGAASWGGSISRSQPAEHRAPVEAPVLRDNGLNARPRGGGAAQGPDFRTASAELRPGGKVIAQGRIGRRVTAPCLGFPICCGEITLAGVILRYLPGRISWHVLRTEWLKRAEKQQTLTVGLFQLQKNLLMTLFRVVLFSLLQDYICPRCESGFIEELPEEPRNTENETSSSTATSEQSRHPFENVDQHLFTLPQGYGQFAFGIFDDSFEFPFGSNVQSEDNRDSENRREREHQSRHRYGARQPRARLAARRAAGRHEGVPTLEGIIQQLVNGIIAPTTIPNLGLGPWGVLHSNPMDYAWGANGLDAIITQLLNQFENTGPPPADKEKIQALPTIQITQEHVDSGLECPVCKEDYTVGENVRQLPCNHLFHNSCIVPWLEQHDTCPVCRKSLSGQNTATNPPGLTGMNFSSSSSSSSSSSPSNENSSNNS
ncbi:PREDICTED: E3 ubiquitin-protein ligase RNF126 [Tinamus guttatus]|nr:PREDICTED: E3 ubiquitin-protein ligase RNF126 [Tinamus guttatus]